MQVSIATLTIRGISPYSQSRQHDEPALDGEGKDDYDKRTWRAKLNVSPVTGTVIIPAHGFHQALIAACRHNGAQIPGQGKKTWTKKFESGIAIVSDIDTGIDPEAVASITISANSDGVRGSGKRVPRRFPQMLAWGAAFDVHILDPIITEATFRAMVEHAGMFIGLGRFRPEKGGTNGRFRIETLEWQDNRRPIAA